MSISENQFVATAHSEKAALILTGGGARAAYQVGVLNAVRELWGDRSENPFPIICGTSAGAVNAAALACYAHNFSDAIRRINWIWRNFRVDQVYRADTLSIMKSVVTWATTLLLGWLVRRSPKSLLDNSPLRELLNAHLDFGQINRNLNQGSLYAVSVTCSGYSSGESLAFYEAHPEVSPWQRAQRIGVATQLSVDHLLASSAIPLVFPAIRIHREFFGDGSMRQLAPVSPAIHLGADRIFVIGAGRIEREGRRRGLDRYPSPAQIAGHAMSSIFLDSLAVDLERLNRVNDTTSKIPVELRQQCGIALKPIEALVISPSERIDFIAARYGYTLPPMLRIALRGVGVSGRSGSNLLSYLLFEKPYTRALIDLGYKDAMARADEIKRFLRIDEKQPQEAEKI